jgi:hypothetical protein
MKIQACLIELKAVMNASHDKTIGASFPEE